MFFWPSFPQAFLVKISLGGLILSLDGLKLSIEKGGGLNFYITCATRGA